jgi:hypothetical protein
MPRANQREREGKNQCFEKISIFSRYVFSFSFFIFHLFLFLFFHFRAR